MTTRGEPITWHHGLMARWWAEFNEAEPDELAFYRPRSNASVSRRSTWRAAPAASCCR